MDWAVANILIIIPDSGGVFCAHHWNWCLSTYPQGTRGLGEHSKNSWCNMGATQPIGIIVLTPSSKSTQMGGFNNLPPSSNSTHLYSFVILNCFHYCPLNRSPHFPLFSLHLSQCCLDKCSASTECGKSRYEQMDIILLGARGMLFLETNTKVIDSLLSTLFAFTSAS
jgi:hypothetical protein